MKKIKSFKVKILIIDDHEIFRQGLKKIINENYKNVLFVEAGNAEEASELYNKENWDIVITDINLPGRSGIEIVKELNQYDPKIPILVLSMYSEDQFAIRVIKAGASGYLSKSSALTELNSAMRNLLDGKKYITESVAEVLVSDLRKNHETHPHSSLSDREFEVFCSLGIGQTVSQIATELSLSVKTISTHRSKILKKMSMKTNADLIKYALEHKLIS